ncbi:uncharacterized protein LOC134836548 [Culicoides brevitarsis]|uniref:uncharacterized protein LOC134836548 n=1 Tax=Culicoides brevitarsis TaxID=469753 RepID=UPI00307C9C53
MRQLLIVLVLFFCITICSAIWCYRCTSATPGCSDKFNWRGIGFLGEQCPEDDDICVKITERKGALEVITRDCLSALKPFRTDIPPDHYEGCYPAAKDVRLGHYVNNSIKELDIHRDFFPHVEYCFCFLDHRCNGVSKTQVSAFAIVFATAWRFFF